MSLTEIASLIVHHDELQTLLQNLHIDSDTIGISEIKANLDSVCSINIDIPGYKFYSTPSKSEAGGVGINVKSDLNLKRRPDHSTNRHDFETIWIEIKNTNSKSVLFCCTYRHPKAEISLSTDHINEIISRKQTCNYNGRFQYKSIKL